MEFQHASGLHAAPVDSCPQCQESAAAEARRRKDNRALLIGLACMLMGFLLAVLLIVTYA